jgi:hypothetical protein
MFTLLYDPGMLLLYFISWFDKSRQQAQDDIYPNEINTTVSHDIC